jgi:hypothetical protein
MRSCRADTGARIVHESSAPLERGTMGSWIIGVAIFFGIGLLISILLDRYTKRRLEENPEALAEVDRAWERLWMEIQRKFRRD